ncbi:helix-turn-helix domain-containing protein [Streptomyces sp. NPDC051940]|uniref:PucR family transcriptional regulator n=1 Tax=Streptomyces sp. NPDC051940 TaxID=3155675 RepID=UPI00342773DC
MQSATRTPPLADPPPLPQQLAAVIRPELPSLFKEILDEIRRALPEYAHARGSAYDRALRTGVERSLDGFTERVAAPQAATSQFDDVHRMLGRFEAQEGRSLDSLQAAYRIGGRVAWRRAMKVGERHRISSQVMIVFADALFAYIDELSLLAREGYLEALSRTSEEREGARRRLARLLVSDTPMSAGAIGALAERAQWPLPETVTPVALRGEAQAPARLGGDVLCDTAGSQPFALIPGPVDEQRREALRAAVPHSLAGVGLTLPLHEAADGLRWARRVLRLAETGVVRDGPLVHCEEHLVTLWLMSDPALVEQIANRRLAPLAGLTASRRDRLTETLRIWLTTRGTAAHMAELLNVHPQTVRYRLRIVEQLFGSEVDDVEGRFALEAALRAVELRNRSHLAEVAPTHDEG